MSRKQNRLQPKRFDSHYGLMAAIAQLLLQLFC